MKVTIKDIARKTGYSINTVARALHNKADVRPETTALIQLLPKRWDMWRTPLQARCVQANAISSVYCFLLTPQTPCSRR